MKALRLSGRFAKDLHPFGHVRIDGATKVMKQRIIKVGDPMPLLGSVVQHGDLKVVVSWRSGLRADKADIVDLAPVIMTYMVYRPLRDNPELFKSVHLTADSTAIAWGNDGVIDMAATTIERLAEESVLQQPDPSRPL